MLGHTDAGDAAFHGGIDGGVAFAPGIKGAAHGLAHVPGNNHQDRHAGENDQLSDELLSISRLDAPLSTTQAYDYRAKPILINMHLLFFRNTS